MRRLAVILTGILAVVWTALPGIVAAQELDIPAIKKTIEPLSAREIESALRTPIPSDRLPAAFGKAALVDKEQAPMQTPEAGAATAVTYSLSYTPGESATPEAQPSPRASGPGRVYNTASVMYLIFAESSEVETPSRLDDILRASIGDQAGNAKLQDISIAGQPSRTASVETVTNGIPIVMDWIAVPVGKVVVVSMTMSGGQAVDRDALLDDAGGLSQAAIDHLRTSVEQSGTPAG